MVLICISLATSDVERLPRLIYGRSVSQALCLSSDGQSVSWSRQGQRNMLSLAPSAPCCASLACSRGAFFPAPESAGGSEARPSRGCACGCCAACLATRSRSCSPGLALGSGLCQGRCGGNPAGRGLRGGPGARGAARPSQGSVGLPLGRAGCCFVLKPRTHLLGPICLPHPAWPENSLFSPHGELARSVHQGSPPVPLLGWGLRKPVKS